MTHIPVDHTVDPDRVPDAPLVATGRHAAGSSTSSAAATCSSCWSARRSRRATAGRSSGCSGPTCSLRVRFAVYYFIMGYILDLHKDVPQFGIHMFAGLVFVHYFTETFGPGRARSCEQGDREEDGDAAGDVPGGLDDGLGLPRRARLVILTVAGVLVGVAPRTRWAWPPDCSASPSSPCGATAVALLFSAANVFFRDFGNIVQHLDHLHHVLVPDDLPLQHRRRSASARLRQFYLLNPVAEARAAQPADLLGRRHRRTRRPPSPRTCPDNLFALGFAHLGVALHRARRGAARVRPPARTSSRSGSR